MAKSRSSFGTSVVSFIFLLAVQQNLATVDAQNFVTQTVYGFLDFTTTIGNTVMVFSPQSVDPGASEKEKPAEPAVIETKPVTPIPTESSPEIKPSKTQAEVEKRPSETSKSVSTVVDVKSNTPVSSKVEVKAQPPSKANVGQGAASVVSAVNVVSAVSPSKSVVQKSIISKVEVIGGSSTTNGPPPIISTKVEVQGQTSHVVATPVISSVVVSSQEGDSEEDEPAVIVHNNIGEPEYDFLSRQPSEFVEETYKVINLKPSSKFHLKHRPTGEGKTKQGNQLKSTSSIRPTGLVTKLGGTVVKDGATTVHETSVIGTYISGKYAQVLQSTSSVVNGKHQKGKINPSPTLRILKTAAANFGKSHKQQQLEPTPAVSVETALPVEGLFNGQNSIRQTRKTTGSSIKSRFKNRPKEQSKEESEVKETVTPQPIKSKKSKTRTSQASKSANEQTTQAPTTAASPGGRKYQSRKNKQSKVTTTTPVPETSNSGFSRRGFKPKIQASSVDPQSSSPSSVYKFKLNRAPGRWQYKTTAKPRVTIRKQNDDDQNSSSTEKSLQDPSPQINDVTPQNKADEVERLEGSESVAAIIDDENSTENKIDSPLLVETIKVEISTPPDFKDTYYEIATIKSPYTFQAGGLKNTRYITVTSTFEKVLEATPTEALALSATEPLTENILATSSYNDKDANFLDSSIATLPPLYVASDSETPPLETKTETFSTTQTMLKTHILPAVHDGNQTSSYTLVQTYLVTRMVIATKTLPPMEAYHFNPSKTLKEFNSHLDEAGSELNLDIAFGDEDNENGLRKTFTSDLDLANIGSDFSLSDIDKARLMEAHIRAKKIKSVTSKPDTNLPTPNPGLSPEQLQQLALLRFLNPAAVPQGQIITTSKPVVKLETVYESHVIPVFNGQSTVLTTVSKVLGTVTKTDYELGTSTIPAVPALPPIAPVNPLFPQQQPQFTVTSSPIVQNTIVTQTESKVLKLTFGAKTAYTTIFSTKVVPTLVTTFMTASVPVQPTAAFPGFFPAPYPPFPYVG